MLAFSGGQANRMEAGVDASGAAPVWDLAGSACQELEGVTNSVVIGVAGLEDGTGRDVTPGFHGDGEGALVESLRKHREDASLVFFLHQWWPHHRVMGQHIHALAGQCLVKELGGPFADVIIDLFVVDLCLCCGVVVWLFERRCVSCLSGGRKRLACQYFFGKSFGNVVGGDLFASEVSKRSCLHVVCRESLDWLGNIKMATRWCLAACTGRITGGFLPARAFAFCRCA